MSATHYQGELEKLAITYEYALGCDVSELKNAIAGASESSIIAVGSGGSFIANPEMVLHEYFDVLRQWSTGYLTRRRYLMESIRCGYRENRFEREAREFAATALGCYRGYLNE
jgi:hypothetical protein